MALIINTYSKAHVHNLFISMSSDLKFTGIKLQLMD